MRRSAPDFVGDCLRSLLTATQICPIVDWELSPKGFTDFNKVLIENNNKMELAVKDNNHLLFFLFVTGCSGLPFVVEIQ